MPFGAFENGLYGKLFKFLEGDETLADRISGDTRKGNYVEGETLFVFHYDWRRSNFANALHLNSFITENLPEGPYDLVAHSMGGLVTRIMLSQRGPSDTCVTATAAEIGLPGDEYQALCIAIYGQSPTGAYPSDHLSATRPAAERMHTFIEMAVPHYGSVNLAATLLEGWGKASELLLGGKLAIQNTILSMAAPIELLPTYDKCCAFGEAYETGNVQADPYNEEFWLDMLLGFGEEPCPYARCETRRALFRNGIANRRIIDEIMDAGLPATVKANHGIIGRYVKNTREVVYVDPGAGGNGAGVTYRTNAEGDGTVHRISALLPNNKQSETFSNMGVVRHAGHPFIIGNTAATGYVYDMLIKPVTQGILAVSGDKLLFVGGTVDTVGLELSETILMVGDETLVTLRADDQREDPFDPAQAVGEVLRIKLEGVDTGEVVEQAGALTLDTDWSLPTSGKLVYTSDAIAIDAPGIYRLSVLDSGGTELAQSHVYVLEK
ncbi:esterase/lipase family protein [Aliishimia ponticola]|uniref:esterase/lipase family protein n=1 Tax=Aliishimia ponticola TaxID=2499833 RepID=UPI001455EAA3|nr:hypothetical protein [Aliishimia ponticola]